MLQTLLQLYYNKEGFKMGLGFQVGQRLLTGTAVGGLVGAGYGTYEKYVNDDYNADPEALAKKGAAVGLGLAGFASYGAVKSAAQRVLKTSKFTDPVIPAGITAQQAALMGAI
jgi:hypothetical protein